MVTLYLHARSNLTPCKLTRITERGVAIKGEDAIAEATGWDENNKIYMHEHNYLILYHRGELQSEICLEDKLSLDKSRCL